MRDKITNIKFNKPLETHLELQNNNFYDNIEDEFDEPDHFKEEDTSNDNHQNEKENLSENKEISTESMDKVRIQNRIEFNFSLLIQKNSKTGGKWTMWISLTWQTVSIT